MGHHQHRGADGPLVPGMPPMLTRVLAVVRDTARLDFTSLHQEGYHVTRCTDPAVAVAELQGLKFHVVMVHIYSDPGGCGAALELLKWAIGQPHLCAYAISEKAVPHGPLDMNDFNNLIKAIKNVASSGTKSPEATLNGPYNTPLSTTASRVKNLPFLERRERRKRTKQVCNIGDQELEHKDGEYVAKEQEKLDQEFKKARVIWTNELHKKFVKAHDKLLAKGDDVPTKILALMKDSTLTRENIASHLQKHRMNLEGEACRYNLRRSHSRTKHHRSTRPASFSSPNMASPQQDPSTIVQSRSPTVYDDRMEIQVQTSNTMDKSSESALVDVPPVEMYPGADDPKQNRVPCVGNSDDNSLRENLSEILNKDPEPSWDDKFLFSGQ
uniref:Uncharacterized protein n=1 Tax=Avena sativa TaxID=4498 RepID=A0ACD5T738_AVESA